MAVAVALTVVGQQVLSAHSRIELDSRRSEGVANRLTNAFVVVDGPQTIARLKAMGVTVNAVAGNVATVQVPTSSLHGLTAVPGISGMEIAHRMTFANDSARYYSNVTPAHTGEVWNGPYTGKGVIVGVIDTGVDYNHINFKDQYGDSRVIAAYMPGDESSTSPVVDGYTLPGSHYCTPQAIAALTTDNEKQSHGTHTMGTAAGSCRSNAMHGVAPDASLVVCAMPDSLLTDVNIANSISYIFDVADRMGMPAVINMSLGSEEGPHDGSSMLCRVIDKVSGPGRICVVSAANDGDRKHVMDHRFATMTDTIYSTLVPYSNKGGWTPGFLTVWSSDDTPHSVSFTAVSKQSGNILFSWEVPCNMKENETARLDSTTSTEFGRYFSDGFISAATAVEGCNGHFHTYADINVKPASDDIVLGVKLASHPGDRMCVWAGNGLVFTRSGHDYMTSGSTVMSISDMATGDSTISVGAYCTRKYMPLADGTLHINTRSNVGDISYFSGYGPDVRGISRPDVTAPGFSLVSSSNRWDTVTNVNTAWRAPGIIVDGVEYTYASQYGTSMSAPVVTGAVALMLQINPQLGPAEIKEILANTSVKDAFTAAVPSRWGSGKLDVAGALRYLLGQSGIDSRIKPELVVSTDSSTGSITISGLVSPAALLTVVDLQGRVVLKETIVDGQTVTIGNNVYGGVYIAVVNSTSQHAAARLLVQHNF